MRNQLAFVYMRVQTVLQPMFQAARETQPSLLRSLAIRVMKPGALAEKWNSSACETLASRQTSYFIHIPFSYKTSIRIQTLVGLFVDSDRFLRLYSGKSGYVRESY